MDNRFYDLWEILAYFIPEDTPTLLKERDKQAEALSRAGVEWAAKVLRKEDMQIYVYRLLLEWARILNPGRRLSCELDSCEICVTYMYRLM